MNAIEFMSELQGQSTIEDLAQLPAREFFETPEGKDILHYLAKEVTVVDANSFKLVDYEVTRILSKDPSYAGRNLFKDMVDLGFSYECISYHQDEAPIRTYLFKVI